ncbi:hypothetical protein PTKIN_Ptkin16aG0007800 [Pterospermum kingtungense]
MAATTRLEAATAFMNRYYTHLKQSPEEFHQFYKASSILSRLGSDGVLHHWTILEAIDNHVVTCFDYFDCKEFDLLSVDAQLSIGFGVHIVVIGCVTTKNSNTKRKFIQSFVLAPMNKPNAYLILNDVLRFLDEEETSKTRVQGVDASTDTSLDPVPADIEAVVPEKSKTCAEGVDSIADPSLDPVPVDIEVPNEEVQKDVAAAICADAVNMIPDPSQDPAPTDIASIRPVQEPLKNASATTTCDNDVDLIADPSLAPLSADSVPNEEAMKDATAASSVEAVESVADPSLDPAPTDIASKEPVQEALKDATAATACVDVIDADPTLTPLSADSVPNEEHMEGAESVPDQSLGPVATDTASNETVQEVLKDDATAADSVKGVDLIADPNVAPASADSIDKEVPKDATATNCANGVELIPDQSLDPLATDSAPSKAVEADRNDTIGATNTTCAKGVDLSSADPSPAPVISDIVPDKEAPKDVESIPDQSVDPLPADSVPKKAVQEVLKESTAATTCINGIDSSSSHSVAVPSQQEATAADPKRSFLTIVNALNGNNAPFKAAPVRKSVPFKESKGKTIYVGNLAMDVKDEQLHQVFKKFGPIKRNGVKAKFDYMNNRCFAFIEFESSSSAESAIKASSITIGNKKVHIQEKKSTKFPPAASTSNGAMV